MQYMTGLNTINKLQKAFTLSSIANFETKKDFWLKKDGIMHVSGRQLNNVLFECFITDLVLAIYDCLCAYLIESAHICKCPKLKTVT